MTDIAIRFRDSLALSRNQKLLPHFGEAGTAVFAVEEIEYSWHDRPLSFDRHPPISTLSSLLDARRDLDYSPSYFGMTSRFWGTASSIANDPLELHRK